MSKTTKSRFRAFAVAFTSFATIFALSGVVYLAPVAHAQELADGDVAKTADSPDVYILKLVGAKQFKRLILNPDIFESYGHLSWGDIQTVSQATLDSYTTSNLVIEVNADGSVADPKVYAVTSAADADVGEKRHLNVSAAEFEAAGLDWDSLYNMNHTEAGENFYPEQTALTASNDLVGWSTLVSGPAEEAEEAVAEGLSVSLASGTPDGTNPKIAQGAANHPVTEIDFTAGGSAVTVSAITVTKGGFNDTNDVSNVKLYDGTSQLGGTNAFNTTTGMASFTGLSWEIAANSTQTLTIKITLDSSTATAGNDLYVGIASASDVTADDTVSGSFPVNGNSFTIAGVSVGVLDIDAISLGNSTVLSGSTNQLLGAWNFDTTSSEGFDIHTIVFEDTGTAVDGDVSNFVLEYLNEPVATAASMASGKITFDLSASPFSVPVSSSRDLYLYGDIASGITASRTIDLQVTNAVDVTAYGQSTGGSVVVTNDDDSSFTSSSTNGPTATINQGSLTVGKDSALNPSDYSVVVGASDQILKAIKFSAGSLEGVRVTKLVLTLDDGTGNLFGATDIQNIRLVDTDGNQVGPSTAFSGTTATFQQSGGLFDVAAGANKTLKVLGDIPSSASYTDGSVVMTDVTDTTTTQITYEGLSSGEEISNVTIQNLSTVGDPLLTSVATGTLTMSLAADNPAADNVALGQNDIDFAHFDAAAASEPILLSSLTLRAYETSGSSDAADTGEVTDVKLYDITGGASTLLGTVANPSSGVAIFSPNLTIDKGETRTLKVEADVSTTATAGTYHFDVNATGDVSAQGSWSGITSGIVSGTPSGNLMSVLAPDLTLKAGATPPAQNLVAGSSDETFASLNMTAGTAEAVKVSSVRITADNSSNLNGASDSTDDIENLKLCTSDGSAILSDGSSCTAVKDLTDADGSSNEDRVNFDGLAMEIAAGTTKVVEIHGDLKSGADGNVWVGVGANADVNFTGLSSGTSGNPDDGTVAGNQITVQTAPILTAAAASNTPVADIVYAGATGQELAVFELGATYADITVSQVTLNDSQTEGNDEFASNGLYLYNGTTLLSQGTMGATTDNEVTFNLPSSLGDSRVVPAGGKLFLTVKADMNTILGGADSGANPILQLDATAVDIVAKHSGSRITVSGSFTDNVDTYSANISSSTTTVSITTDADNFAVGDVICFDEDNGGACSSEEQMIVTAINSPSADDLTVIRGANGSTAVAHTSGTNDDIMSYSPSAVSGNEQIVRGSEPVFEKVALDTTVLANGQDVPIYRVKVTANNGDIALKKLTFYATGQAGGNALGNNSTTAELGSSGLLATSTGETVVNNVTLYNKTEAASEDVTTTNYSVAYHNSNAGTNHIVIVFDSEEVVSAGTSETFELRADIANVDTSGDYLSVSMPQENSGMSNPSTADLEDLDSTAAEYFLGLDSDTSAAAAHTANTSSFYLWSDLAEDNDGDATSHSGGDPADGATAGSSDWTNGYKVADFPLGGSTLTSSI